MPGWRAFSVRAGQLAAGRLSGMKGHFFRKTTVIGSDWKFNRYEAEINAILSWGTERQERITPRGAAKKKTGLDREKEGVP